MFKWLYHLILVGFYLGYLPQLFSAKYSGTWKERLGFTLPHIDQTKKGPLLWIHAVSMGEVKIAAAFVKELRLKNPSQRFVISFVTKTGKEEALRLIQGAEAYFFLPIDLSFIIRRVVRAVRPTQMIVIEGEFWYNLFSEVKKSGATLLLVNGKLSTQSYRRFSLLPQFAGALFSHFDFLLLQDEEYLQRFFDLGVPQKKMAVVGNIKIDASIPMHTLSEKKACENSWGIEACDFVVTIGSTHKGEERGLLACIKPLFDQIPCLKVLLVPRHPERFDEVASELKLQKIPFGRSSCNTFSKEPVILVDEMGKLPICYQCADVGIVAGSFVPGIGGHNLFEPVVCGIPVLFGPYFEGQKGLAEALFIASCGISLPLEKVAEKIKELYETPGLREEMGKNAQALFEKSKGCTKKTIDLLASKSLL